MSWTAIVPAKIGAPRKTRLAERFSAVERERLADLMATHVTSTLKHAPSISRNIVLSPARPIDSVLEWWPDQGLGLNSELERVRRSLHGASVVVVLADLPLLAAEDVEALIAAGAETGAAYAPDRHGVGANAVAVAAEVPLEFCFGPGSAARFAPQATAVHRVGLAFDIDTPADFDAALSKGWGRLR